MLLTVSKIEKLKNKEIVFLSVERGNVTPDVGVYQGEVKNDKTHFKDKEIHMIDKESDFLGPIAIALREIFYILTEDFIHRIFIKVELEVCTCYL